MIIYPYPAGPSRPTIASVQKAVANHYGLSVEDLKGRSTHRRITRPRQAAIYLARTLCQRSTTILGREFNRDHSSIIYSLRLTEQKLASAELKNELDEITRSIS